LEIKGKKYELEYDSKDPFVAPDLAVAYSSELAEDFMPILLDPRGQGSKPYPPEFVAYRLVVDSKAQKLCVLYEVYWRRQDCTWKELNKDHDHDYEQIQIHFNMITGEKEKVIVSSVGPVEYAGHGIEVYSNIAKAEVRGVEYATSPKGHFPWGGERGRKNISQVRDIPIGQLVFENGRPVVIVLNCYHAFVGLKQKLPPQERNELNPRLEKLSRRLIERWYYRHVKNRFGHDVSKPFDEPYIMYYPPPEDLKSRLVYGFLWLFRSTAVLIRSRIERNSLKMGPFHRIDAWT
jgi:hypothetical protein